MNNFSVSVKVLIAVVVVLVSIAVGYFLGRGTNAFGGRQSFGGNFPAGQMRNFEGARSRTNAGGGMIGGEVTKIDNDGLTLELRDGGSRLIRFSTSTEVQKMTDGSVSDLSVGTSVNVFGPANSDGSVTASSIQVRPDVPMGGGLGPR